jgi:hypothetical protein
MFLSIQCYCVLNEFKSMETRDIILILLLGFIFFLSVSSSVTIYFNNLIFVFKGPSTSCIHRVSRYTAAMYNLKYLMIDTRKCIRAKLILAISLLLSFDFKTDSYWSSHTVVEPRAVVRYVYSSLVVRATSDSTL